MGFEKNFLLLFCLLEAVDVAVSSPAPYDAEKVTKVEHIYFSSIPRFFIIILIEIKGRRGSYLDL